MQDRCILCVLYKPKLFLTLFLTARKFNLCFLEFCTFRNCKTVFDTTTCPGTGWKTLKTDTRNW